jgi:hypothetical protein
MARGLERGGRHPALQSRLLQRQPAQLEQKDGLPLPERQPVDFLAQPAAAREQRIEVRSRGRNGFMFRLERRLSRRPSAETP